MKSSWKKENGHYVFDVQIPANTTATFILPKELKDAEYKISYENE